MDEDPQKVTVFLLDDHELVREGVRQLLEADGTIEVVGEAATCADAITRIRATRPQVAVLDVQLPDGSGVEVCREVRSVRPDLVCLMLTSFSDEEALFQSVMAGAAGYVLKQIRGNDLVSAVHRVARGESLIDPAVTGQLLERLRQPEPGPGPAAGGTDRARANHPRPGGRRSHQPPDRGQGQPGRKDGQELHVVDTHEARHDAAHRGSRVRREGQDRTLTIAGHAGMSHGKARHDPADLRASWLHLAELHFASQSRRPLADVPQSETTGLRARLGACRLHRR